MFMSSTSPWNLNLKKNQLEKATPTFFRESYYILDVWNFQVKQLEGMHDF